VVLFDDPVSSLDSAILFVVSGLIRGLCDDVRTGKGNIKQIFVLTHNVYFHKQVTFNAKRGDEALREETFWIVRKQGLTSKVEKHNSNPVKTNYEMLWAEVRSPNPSKHTIQNIMRRILEHYFTILGRTNTDDICKQFTGNEYLMCRSLFSWVNAGSHSVQEDAEISIDDSAVQGYLQVFRGIFEKSGHLPHYEMMMRGAGVEMPVDGLAS
jgi:wobble nucleotide-excising tRNase